MFGGSPTKVFGPTVLASWTTLRKPAVLLLCFGGALRTMELELLLLLIGPKTFVGLPPNIDFPFLPSIIFVSSLNIMDDQLF
jgi:hypothetical protein